MSLAEHLPPEPKTTCFVDRLTPAHGAEFAVLLTGSRSNIAISTALRGAGYDVGPDTVRKHRAGQCHSCRVRAAVKHFAEGELT